MAATPRRTTLPGSAPSDPDHLPLTGGSRREQNAKKATKMLREMSVVLLHDDFDAAHLAAVTDEMRRLGPPTLRAIEAGDNCAYLLEGCHRARAAKALGLPITIEWVDCPEDDAIVCDLLGDDQCESPVSHLLSRPGPSFWLEVEA